MQLIESKYIETKFAWCTHHHGNAMMHPARPPQRRTRKWKGIWQCHTCNGLLNRVGDIGECWEALDDSVI